MSQNSHFPTTAVRVEESRTMLSAECTPAAQDLPFAHFVYMDDVIVDSGNKEDHIRDLRCLFQRMKEVGLLLNKNKFVLGRSSIKFLGHIVDSQGI